MTLVLTVLAEDAHSLTVGWAPLAGALGYEFLIDGKRASNTWDPAVKQVKFGKPDAGEHVYQVVALSSLASGSLLWPSVTPPPPTFKVKAMYDASGGGKAANWPAIAAQGFNVSICSADDSASLAAVKTTGGKAWVMPGYWTGSSFSLSDTQAVALAKSAVATGAVCGFYVADEPTYSAQNVAAIKARSALLKQACPGVETLLAYYDAASLPNWKGAVDAFALDIYPSRFNWNYSLITQLAAAADAAGLRYYGIVGAFADAGYPLPTAAQLQTMVDTWAATKQVGYGCYAWGPTGGSSAQQLQNQPALLAVLKAANAA